MRVWTDSLVAAEGINMEQRASLARTLSQGSEVLLMDKPFEVLDEQARMLLGNDLVTFRETQ